MRVPITDLRRQLEPLRGQILAEWDRLLREGNFILGPDVEKFEKAIAAKCESKYAVGMTSGTDALFVALRALDLPAGSKVLTTPFTFFGTISAMVNAGLEPAFADVEPEGFNIDVREAEKVLAADTEKKISAIMAVHLFGQAAEMAPLMELAKKYEIPVVEDAAQAIGATYRGKQVGNFGDIGCFSFYPTKNLHALGDAGMCTTNSEKLDSRMRSLRNHGSDVRYYHDRVGGNFRLDAVQAVALGIFLPHLDSWLARRREIAAGYDQVLGKLHSHLVTPVVLPDREHIYHQYTIRVRSGKRDSLHCYLKECGIASAVYYPVPCHLQKALAQCGYKSGDFPVTEKLASEVLSLPIFPTMTSSEQALVVDTILHWAERQTAG